MLQPHFLGHCPNFFGNGLKFIEALGHFLLNYEGEKLSLYTFNDIVQNVLKKSDFNKNTDAAAAAWEG